MESTRPTSASARQEGGGPSVEAVISMAADTKPEPTEPEAVQGPGRRPAAREAAPAGDGQEVAEGPTDEILQKVRESLQGRRQNRRVGSTALRRSG